MSFDLILKNINKHIPLSAKEEGCFVNLLQLKRLKKKQFLLQENQVCRYSAFVTKGCLRGYTIDPNGYEHILQFAPPEWWIADMYSLITEQPGNFNIDALDDTEVLLLAKKDQEKLFADVPKFERFFRIITENSLITSRLRVMDNLSQTAQERYNTFCNRYPSLIEWLPQKQIAAYIGVTPEFFSKMRTDFLRKK